MPLVPGVDSSTRACKVAAVGARAPAVVATASVHTVREHNRALVLGAVADRPGRSRAEWAEELGLYRATVSTLVEDLLARRLIRETRAERSGRGRPALPLELDPDGPAALGVELGVDHLTAVVVDLTGVVRDRRDTAPGRTPATTLRRIARLAAGAITSAGLQVSHGAIAVPGLLDRSTTIRRLPNMPGWQGHDIAAELGAATGVTFRADNEANFAALADLRRGAVGTDFLHVSGEIGVGAAFVTGGVLHRGPRGFAGELGHTVVDPAGPRCGCGANGCLEQYVGRQAILASAGADTVDDLVELADGDSPRAVGALAEAGRVLGLALADAANLLDVPRVVFGGIYARLFPWLEAPVRAQLDAHVLSRDLVGTDLARSPYGVDAAVIGAAAAVLDDLLTGRVLPTDSRDGSR